MKIESDTGTPHLFVSTGANIRLSASSAKHYIGIHTETLAVQIFVALGDGPLEDDYWKLTLKVGIAGLHFTNHIIGIEFGISHIAANFVHRGFHHISDIQGQVFTGGLVDYMATLDYVYFTGMIVGFEHGSQVP
ncbi:hypothetical protein DSCO28_54310 [Desulfosarcina ovata subsp. sediminis]|uniref:Uncharacterized protein n=1 Tax=Desulfosarcina ovata subsp. sediminis TaxID=885957 RepID=A0A5K7ZX76_9BACT|nr:hypothetical protein DSCO28_54310 [Desulfosarcina ovata subsp. sediminis]